MTSQCQVPNHEQKMNNHVCSHESKKKYLAKAAVIANFSTFQLLDFPDTKIKRKLDSRNDQY